MSPFVPSGFFNSGIPLVRAPYTFIPIHTPGHSPGHTCIYERKTRVLFSGDHVLGKITPNISAHPMSPLSDPLHSYLESLERLLGLKATLTLPAHGPPIHGLGDRIDAIQSHHKERSLQILEALRGSRATTYSVSKEIFGTDLSPLDHWMALYETLAHLIYMEHEGRVSRENSEGTTTICWSTRPISSKATGSPC